MKPLFSLQDLAFVEQNDDQVMIGSALYEDLSSNDVTLCTITGIDSSKENINPGQVVHPR